MSQDHQRHFFMEPLDVLLFRDGRPFSAGTDSRASSMFPPTPVTFYGALRTSGMINESFNFTPTGPVKPESVQHSELGTAEMPGDMEICHFSLARREGENVKLLFPLPANILLNKNWVPDDANQIPVRYDVQPAASKASGNSQGSISTLMRPNNFDTTSQDNKLLPISNFPLPTMRFLWSMPEEEDWFASKELWLDMEQIQQYLSNEPITELDKYKSILVKEPRSSTKLGSTGTAEDAMLYSVEFLRLRDQIGFALSVKNATSLANGNVVVRIGGEARSVAMQTASFSLIDPNTRAAIQQGLKNSGKFVIYLRTPALFENGWYPDFIRADGTGVFRNTKVSLVGASLGRAINLGGWDLVKRRPKLARKAVPAGSVFFFEIEGALTEEFGLQPFSSSLYEEPGSEYRKQGLGQYFLGLWPD